VRVVEQALHALVDNNGKKTFSKKHKSRRGRKTTSNKTRRFRGGNPFLAAAAINTFTGSKYGREAMDTAAQMAAQRLPPPNTPSTLLNGTQPF
jgi:hypothetical protein